MYQHEAHLANIVTSYCTCLGGIMPLLYCVYTGVQPRRWVMVYFFVFLTGLPTVWLHAVEGNRVASFFDTGSNILLAWWLIVAASGDFLQPSSRKKLIGITLACNLLVWAWLIAEIFAAKKIPLISFGAHGYFNVGEVALIANCWVTVILFIRFRKQVSRASSPFLYTVIVMFFAGMLLATASNSHISLYILPWHAAWHILGAFGFITFWVFNHVRFSELAMNQQSS